MKMRRRGIEEKKDEIREEKIKKPRQQFS